MDIDTWSEIRKLYHVKGLYKKNIAERLGLSIKTVRRALKRETPPEKITRDRQSKLEPFKERIHSLIKDYPKLSGIRIAEEISRLGYTGGLTTLRNYLLKIRPSNKEAFVRVETEPGEQAQVDWALFGDYFNCGRILSCFVFVLSYSRMVNIEWTLSQKIEEFLRCHQKSLHLFGGVPQKILYDNLKSVVLKRQGKLIQFNPKFTAFSGTYLFEPIPCNVRRGNEKGKVERIIHYIRNSFFYGRSFNDLSDLQTQSDRWRDEIANQRVHRTLKQKPIERFLIEKDKLKNLPNSSFDCETTASVKASKDCRVTFDANTYSVPSIYTHIPLTLKANHLTVRLYKQDRLIATHQRCWLKYKDIEEPKHFEALLELKQKAHQAKQKDMFLSLGSMAEDYFKGLIQTPRSLNTELKKIEALITVYGKTEVLQAIEQSLPFNAFGSEYLKNIILQNLTKRNQVHPIGSVDSKTRPEIMSLKVQERDLEKYHQLIDSDQDQEITTEQEQEGNHEVLQTMGAVKKTETP